MSDGDIFGCGGCVHLITFTPYEQPIWYLCTHDEFSTRSISDGEPIVGAALTSACNFERPDWCPLNIRDTSRMMLGMSDSAQAVSRQPVVGVDGAEAISKQMIYGTPLYD